MTEYKGEHGPELVKFTFGEEHEVGNPDCIAGWCGNEFPAPHADMAQTECPGLMHANFFDESNDNVLLEKQCDVCGESP